MSRAAAEAAFERFRTDEEFRERIIAAHSIDELTAALEAGGHDATGEEYLEVATQRLVGSASPTGDESLDETALSSVSGGFYGGSWNRPTVGPFYGPEGVYWMTPDEFFTRYGHYPG